MNLIAPKDAALDPTDRPGERPRVLVVDDVADNREILTRRLEPRGFDVTEAESGEEALALLTGQRFDIVLLDIMMPGTGGMEVLRRVRRTLSDLELPVIMVSAKSQSEDIVACLENGANDYITKPVDLAVALARIRTQLTRTGALDRDPAGDGEACAAPKSQRLQYMAYHDGLTGLLNRTAFRERLAAMLHRCRDENGPASVLFVDLDRFKAVNDVHGHEAGDRLLGQVARRLRRAMGQQPLMARLGGDEFAVAFGDGCPAEEVERRARSAVEALGQPFELDGQPFQVGASCGIAHAAQCGSDMDQLLKAADLAMYAAKKGGRNRAVRFEPGMLDAQRDRSALEVEFRAAMQEGRLELYYQPLIDARTGDLTSFEALLRWPHATRGMITPDVFIPVAERTGLIVPLGGWVLRRACAGAATWPEAVRVAVNLSPLQFRNPGLLDTIAGALRDTGLAPERLELEITESALLEADGCNFDVLRAIHGMGVRVSMDDFGTGYSSMAYLQQFRFDKIKIDRRFVGEVGRQENSTAIIKAIVDLGAQLGIDTAVEGVETAEQYVAVRQHGCTEMQGSYFGKPVDAVATREFIARFPEPRRRR